MFALPYMVMILIYSTKDEEIWGKANMFGPLHSVWSNFPLHLFVCPVSNWMSDTENIGGTFLRIFVSKKWK